MRIVLVTLLAGFAGLIWGCTKKDVAATVQVVKSAPAVVAPKELDFSKPLREAIYFSNSLEREALKLILKDPSFRRQTLFSVLSFVVEINSGAKRSTPFGLDCGRFEIRKSIQEIAVFKSCVKPETEVARISIVKADEHYRIKFLMREWAAVVGWSAALTGSDVNCEIKIRDKKLEVLKCENWSYQTIEDQTSSTVIKAEDFHFERSAPRQFVVNGGFFKELVENKKINIVVPLEGKIKIIEKEIEVIDEFIKEEPNEKKEEPKIESPEKSSEETGEKSHEESGQENQTEGQTQSEDTSQDVNQDAGQETGQEIQPENQNPEVDPTAPSTRGRGR